MKVIVELSMYPLREDYEKPILAFIERLNQRKEVEVHTSAMSTEIRGEYNVVMDLLKTEMFQALQTDPATVMVMKVLRK